MLQWTCTKNLWLLCVVLLALAAPPRIAFSQDADVDIEEAENADDADVEAEEAEEDEESEEAEEEPGLGDVMEAGSATTQVTEEEEEEEETTDEPEAVEEIVEEPADAAGPGALIVVAYDSSYSMNRTDPKGHTKQALQMLVALAGRHDRVAVMSYGRNTRAVVPPTELDTDDRRLWVQKRIGRMGNSGGTNFTRMLDSTAELLAKADAPKETHVMLISDGQHSQGGSARDAIRKLKAFRKQGWRVHTISLAKSGRSLLLEKIAELTGGLHVQPTDHQDLLPSILRLSGINHRYWTYRGDIRSDVMIRPGARSLIYLAQKGDPTSGIESLRARDTEISGDFYRFPAKARKSNQFDLLGLDNPPAGAYSASAKGKLADTLVLQEPPFRIEIDPSTPTTIYRGDKLRIKAVATTDAEPEILAGFRDPDNVNVEVEVVRIRDGKSLGIHPLALQDESDDDRRVLFLGSIRMPDMKVGGPNDQFSVQVVAEVDRKSRKLPGWVHELTFEVEMLNQNPPIRVMLAESERKLGSIWTDSPLIEGKLKVSMGGREGLQITATPKSDALTVEPNTFELDPEGEIELSYSFDPSKIEPGVLEQGVTFTGVGKTTGGTATEATFSLTGAAFRMSGLNAMGGVTLTAARWPDPSVTKLALKVEPETGFKLKSASLQIEGETGLESLLDTRLVEDTITTPIPRDGKLGLYKGVLTAKFDKASGLPPRAIPMDLTVKEPEATLAVEPKELKITFEKTRGWAEGILKIRFAYVDNTELVLKPSDLTGEKNAFTISAEYDILLKPLDDWDGKTLKPGATHELRFKAAVSTDMRDDRYVGQLKLTSRYKGKAQTTTTVNVTLDVKRKR